MFIWDRQANRGAVAVLATALALFGLGEGSRALAAGVLRPTGIKPTSSTFHTRPVAVTQPTQHHSTAAQHEYQTYSCYQSGFYGYADTASCAHTRAHLIRAHHHHTGTAASAKLSNTHPHTGNREMARLNGFLSGGPLLTSQFGEPVLTRGYLPAVLGAGGYPSSYYPPDPYAGYSADGGAGAAIDAQGTYLVSEQRAGTLREFARQRQVDTRRRAFDEYLYERKNAPTWEDDRERLQGEELRRSRKEPPLNEIVSARALNALLDHLQKQDAAGAPGEDVALEEDVLSRVNVTAGRGGHIGLLKNGGRLHWPLALAGDTERADRTRIDGLLTEALSQASGRSVDADAVNEMSRAADRLRLQLAQRSRNLPPGQYVEAKRFLGDLEEGLKALQQPDAGDYLSHKTAARGKTVAQLVRSMTEQGLHFAPAVNGDEAAYLALHRALALYDSSTQLHAQR